jgi:hypothetical protein
MKENCATLDFHEISRAEGPNRHTRWASFPGFGHNLRMTMEQLYVRHDEVDRFNARMPRRYGAFVKGIFGSPLRRPWDRCDILYNYPVYLYPKADRMPQE